MKLLQFRVQSFRSIGDTGWIDISDVTAFIGTNESGKSNILLALWKLNPAREGEIDLKSDAPRKQYNTIRNINQKPIFIEADFELEDSLIRTLVEVTEADIKDLNIVRVSRNFDGAYAISFPNVLKTPTIQRSELQISISNYQERIANLQPAGKTEKPLYDSMVEVLNEVARLLESSPDALSARHVKQIQTSLQSLDLSSGLKSSEIVPVFSELLELFDKHVNFISRPSPDNNEKARNLIKENLPKFIYYANYGNLDSEIYLPHVISNMSRADLGSHEAAKARTLKVLFEFVKLKPSEILELGKDLDDRQRQPTQDEIHAVAEKKREREILLQSASTELTQKFLNWWRQGNYRFRFQADGNHFRIWVADQIRPEEIELEGRSAGLQWFLSFFLVFLVERSEAHRNAILLLDEPGVSLHPIAQEDLFEFFETLSAENQIIYTAHSPFMVDPNHLERVRAVYFDEDGEDQGLTKVSTDLRAKEKQSSEERSVYPVHAALGLSVSPVLLVGCRPVIVEGMSDQYYLSAIKNLLIARGHIKPSKELLFLPSGSFKGIKAVIPILVGRDEELPFVILDSDSPGKQIATQLRSSLYENATDHLIALGEICGFDQAEIEDLLPTDVMAYVITRYLRGPEEEFADVVNSSQPIVPQVESYAHKHNIELDKGWKVEVAKRVKDRLIRHPEIIADENEKMKIWQTLFDRFAV